MIGYFAHAKNLGLKILLRFVWYVNKFDQTGQLNDTWLFMNATDPDTFFSNSLTCMLPFVASADALNVDAVSIGAETPFITTNPRYTGYWTELINQIRIQGPGMSVTYCSLPTLPARIPLPIEWQQVVFWDQLDWIGIDAYWSLASETQPLPPLAVTTARYNQILDEVRKWRSASNLEHIPVVFTETGFLSSAMCLVVPWAYPTHGCKPPQFAPDNNCQMLGYQTTFDVLQTNTDLVQGLFMQWMDMPANPDNYDPPDHNGDMWPCFFTPRGKPALKLLTQAYAMP